MSEHHLFPWEGCDLPTPGAHRIIGSIASGVMQMNASGDAAEAQMEMFEKGMAADRRSELENRAFYMDLYRDQQDIYNREQMRAEPFREAGLYGLEQLIGTQAFQEKVQPYVTQSQKDLWESPTYAQPGSDPGMQKQIDGYKKFQQAKKDGGYVNAKGKWTEFRPSTGWKDIPDWKAPSDTDKQKMYMKWIDKHKGLYESMLPPGVDLKQMGQKGGVNRWLADPYIVDKYMNPIDEGIMQAYLNPQQSQGPGPMGAMTPVSSEMGSPVMPGGAPVGGAFGSGAASGWWGGGGATPAAGGGMPVAGGGVPAMGGGMPPGMAPQQAPGAPPPMLGGVNPELASNVGGPFQAPAGTDGSMPPGAEQLPGPTMAGPPQQGPFTQPGQPVSGGGTPGAMFSQPEYQGYQMAPEYTMDAFMQDPSTQRALQEIGTGIESSAVARTGTLGANEMNELTDRYTDYIYNKYPMMRNMMFGEQMSQKQQNEAEQMNAFNRWTAGTLNPAQNLAGMGQTAGAQSAPVPSTSGAPYSQGQGEYLAAMGNAKAAGILGNAAGASTIASGIGNTAAIVGGYFAGGGGAGGGGAAGASNPAGTMHLM